MNRTALLCCAVLVAPCVTRFAAQQRAVPHDSVHGAIRAIDVRARTVEITAGVGYALRDVRLQVPAAVPITDRHSAQSQAIEFSALKLGDVVRAQFGGYASPFLAYTIERVGTMTTGANSTP